MLRSLVVARLISVGVVAAAGVAQAQQTVQSSFAMLARQKLTADGLAAYKANPEKALCGKVADNEFVIVSGPNGVYYASGLMPDHSGGLLPGSIQTGWSLRSAERDIDFTIVHDGAAEHLHLADAMHTRHRTVRPEDSGPLEPCPAS